MPLRNLVSSSIVVALQSVDCQHWLKGKFSKFLEELLCRTDTNTNASTKTNANIQNFSCYFTKNRFHHRQFPSVLKSLLTLKRGICSGVGFQYSCEWYIGQIKLLKISYVNPLSASFALI